MDSQELLLINKTLYLEGNTSASAYRYAMDYAGKLPIYVITLHHLYPVVVAGRVIHILWYLIGLIGNYISLKIWTLSRMRKLNSSALYLISITFCDIACQFFHVFFYLKYFWGLRLIGLPGVCQIWNVLNVIPQYAGQLLVLGFTIERLISVVKPFQGERFSKRQRAPKVIVAIFAFVIIISVPQGAFWTVDESGFCEIKLSVVNIYGVWSVVTESIIFLVVPLTTLVLNVFLLNKARKSLASRKDLTVNETGHSRVHHKKGKVTKPATKTLLSISFFRILTQLPVSVTYTIHNLDKFSFGQLLPLAEITNDPQNVAFLQYWAGRIIIEIIGASHYALSVFIFYASTKQFRSEIRRLFRTVRNTLLQRKSTSTIERIAPDMRFSNYTSVHRKPISS